MKLARTDLVFMGLALGTGALCYFQRGADAVLASAAEAGLLFLQILPQLTAGLLIGGLVTRLVSREKVAGLLGGSSGVKGLMVATIAGALTPGGPFTSFPMVYALWIAGADAGALITFIASWSLLGFNRLIVWELPLLGVEFTAIRYIACLPLPIIAGLIARWMTRFAVLRLERPAE